MPSLPRVHRNIWILSQMVFEIICRSESDIVTPLVAQLPQNSLRSLELRRLSLFKSWACCLSIWPEWILGVVRVELCPVGACIHLKHHLVKVLVSRQINLLGCSWDRMSVLELIFLRLGLHEGSCWNLHYIWGFLSICHERHFVVWEMTSVEFFLLNAWIKLRVSFDAPWVLSVTFLSEEILHSHTLVAVNASL